MGKPTEYQPTIEEWDRMTCPLCNGYATLYIDEGDPDDEIQDGGIIWTECRVKCDDCEFETTGANAALLCKKINSMLDVLRGYVRKDKTDG